MRRWTRQALSCAAIAAGLWSAVIFLPQQWVAAPAATVLPSTLALSPLPDSARSRATTAMFGPNLSRQFECLALNIYWEAKSEPMIGKVAVAAVTLNRLFHPEFPDTICGVVWQGASGSTRSCQFSWACDRRSNTPRDPAAWQQAREIAYQMLFFEHHDPTHGALYFHATYVKPQWARSMVRVTRIGRHIFYREPMSAEDETRRSRS
jgi:spore germination cell wall hydrolase CwlJ-like protein